MLKLTWNDVGEGRDYHAAYVTLQGATGTSGLHTHDFHEAMLVLEGTGTHVINGTGVSLRPRDLIFIRPHDYHAIITRGGQSLQFINIAWRSSVWHEFAAFAGQNRDFTPWEEAAMPVTARVSRAGFAACRQSFDTILSAFHADNGRSDSSRGGDRAPLASRLELSGFWAKLVSQLSGFEGDGYLEFSDSPADSAAAARPPWPAWLRQACHAMRGDNLQVGLPRFVELAGVTPEHLSRTLRACSGLTPTEWINARRLQQAALLLATTPNSVSDIAFDCGFSNVSYFHRLFRQRYGDSPRGYRLQASRVVAP